MRYGTQKIRDPDTRARHVSRRINKGYVHSSLRLLVFFSAREKFVAESVGTLTREDQPRLRALSLRPLIARRVNIRLGDFCLDCVILDRCLSGKREGEYF